MAKTKKLTAIILSVLTLFSVCALLSGCGGSQDYPVKVGNLTINEQPQNVVALSDNAADIMSAIGYDVTLVGRSDECTQESLQIVPSVGSKSNPDVSFMINSKTDLVFADTTLSPEAEEQIKAEGITIVKISQAQSDAELSVLYGSMGAILGGNVTGRQKATDAFTSLASSVEEAARSYTSSTFITCGYLYLDNGTLKTFPKESYADTLFSYTGASNVASGATVAQINGLTTDDGTIDVETLKRSNPTYIFYSDQSVLDMLKNDATLKNLDAVKNGRTYELAYNSIIRQGNSVVENVKFMCSTMYPQASGNEGATQPTSEHIVDISTVADKYGITITEDMQFKLEDENSNVMALQKRLDDLGYMTVEPTGYFGELTVSAIKDFESANGMEQTGEANYETLTAIFSTDAKKRETPAREQ